MRCPHCQRSLGSLSKSGEHRVRLRIVLIDPDTSRVHGPCAKCGKDVTVAESADLNKALSAEKGDIRLGIRL